MRLFSTALVIAALVPAMVQAGSVKKIEVINFPAVQEVTGYVEVTNDAANPVEIVGEVEVTNLPASSGPARFQLVGFTSATYSGNLGGNFGATEKCQLEFPESRMCRQDEAVESTSIPSGLTGEAWANPIPGNSFGSKTCLDWTRDDLSTNTGPTVRADGSKAQDRCDLVVQPIACCDLLP